MLGRLINFDTGSSILVFHFPFFSFLQHHEILYRPQLIDTDVVTASLAQPMRYHSFMPSLPRALPWSHFLFNRKILRNCPAPFADVCDKTFYTVTSRHTQIGIFVIFSDLVQFCVFQGVKCPQTGAEGTCFVLVSDNCGT